MLEISAFARRRSQRKSLNEDDLLYPNETTETTATRSNSNAKRLLKPRFPKDSTPRQRPEFLGSRERGSRNSLIELTRRSFDRRSRSSLIFSEPSSPVVEAGSSKVQELVIVEESLDITSAGLPVDPEDDMSADLLKTVAKKASLKNILCDKPTGSDDDDGIDIDAAVKLLQELKKRASPEELVALHRALLPTKKVDNVTEEPTLSPYSRRSSIVTPGIATRAKSPGKSPKTTHKKQRPLSEQIVLKPGERESLMTRQSSCGLLPPHRGVPNLSRSYSPAELDVSAIGGLRLGTLRVTNGTVSPEPSIISEREIDPLDTITGCATSAGHKDVNIHPLDKSDDEDGAVTPRAGLHAWNPNQLPTRNGIIPGLDIYHDSSEDDSEGQKEAVSLVLADGTNQDTQSTTEPFRRQAFNVSIGSFVSRLSTIQDDESLAEERNETPSRALQKLTGTDAFTSPPPSSGSDTSFYSQKEKRLSPLHSNPRPRMTHQNDSGYASEIPITGRFSSDDDDAAPHKALHSSRQQVNRRSREVAPSVGIVLDSIPSQGTLENLEEQADASGGEITPLTARDRSHRGLSVPPMQRNPPSSSDSIPSVLSEGNVALEPKTPEKAGKARKKLYKPPPTRRTSSDVDAKASTPQGQFPTVPDEVSVNFSRRICRTPGSYHPEHAFAAQARISQESLEITTKAKDLPSKDVPKTPKTPVMSSPAEIGPKSGPSGGEPEVQKKKSRFRLRGRSRSKSMSRPEASLPKEREIPTVADTVPQYADIVRANDASAQARGSATPLSSPLAEKETQPRRPAAPSPQRVSRSHNESKSSENRARSASRGLPTADRRYSHAVGLAPQDEVPRRRRSKSMAAHPGRRVRDDTDEDQSATPKASRHARNTSVQHSSSPKPTHEARKDRRNTLSQVFLRSTSGDRAGRSDSKSPKTPDVNNPAYIASRYTSPPPIRGPPMDRRGRSDGKPSKAPDVNNPAYIAPRFSSPPPDRTHRPMQTPRHIPWEAEHPRSTPPSDPRQVKADVVRTDSAVSTSHVHTPTGKSGTSRSTPLASINTNLRSYSEKDQNYRAYRQSDAVSINKLVSPAPEKQTRLHVPDDGNQKRWSHISSATPSPDSLFDRYGGGLDYGWERGSGFSGSAGTRSTESNKAHRKSVVLSEQYGVDLSDVPVFVKKAA